MRLHSALGYVTPQDLLAGRQAGIHAARNRDLDEAHRPGATSPAAGGVCRYCDYVYNAFTPGNQRQALQGCNHAKGYSGGAHRTDAQPEANEHRMIDPNALKIPALKGRNLH